jgi:hypothetical protein
LQGRGYYDDTVLRTLSEITQPTSPEMLEYIPGDSFGLLSGQGLASAWQQAASMLEADADFSAGLNQARSYFTAFTGLDLDQDGFGWMDQGFSFFLFPTEQTPLTWLSPDLNIGVGVALQTSDRTRAETTLATLEERLGTGFISIDTSTLNGDPVSSWGYYLDADDQLDSFLGYGWANDDTLLLTTSLESLADLLTLEPTETLPHGFRFSQSTRDFPEQNQGYLYLNTAPMRSLFAQFFPPNHGDAPTSKCGSWSPRCKPSAAPFPWAKNTYNWTVC